MWREEQEKHQPAIAAPSAPILVFRPVFDDFASDRAPRRVCGAETKKYDEPLNGTIMLVSVLSGEAARPLGLQTGPGGKPPARQECANPLKRRRLCRNPVDTPCAHDDSLAERLIASVMVMITSGNAAHAHDDRGRTPENGWMSVLEKIRPDTAGGADF
jgi:hypothetical protein